MTTDILQSALSKAHKTYTTRNPKSNNAHNEALKYLPGGNTRSSLHASPFPLTFQSGRGSTLTSLDGDTYKDFLGEYSAGIFGHSNAQISQAVNSVMSDGWNLGGISTFESQFAQRVCERFGLGMVRFTNSGTEANMMALAAGLEFVRGQQAQAEVQKQEQGVQKKRKILVFSNAYHGGTISFPMKLVMQLRKGEDVASTNLPHEFVVAPFNNVLETQRIVDGLLSSSESSEPESKPTTRTSSLAAILVEPMQGAGGCRPASREFLTSLRNIADAHSALLIADEVMTSRLAGGGKCAELGVRPDLITLGKWIGGGMSFGAFGGRKDVMQLFDPVSGTLSHAGTFNNNVLSMAAGLVGLDICSPDRIEELNSLGEWMKGGIRKVLGDFNLLPTVSGSGNESKEYIEIDSFHEEAEVGDDEPARIFVAGCGSLVSIRFSGANSNLWYALFLYHMLEENIYLATRGYTALTIELTEKDTEDFVEAVKKFVLQYHKSLKKYA